MRTPHSLLLVFLGISFVCYAQKADRYAIINAGDQAPNFSFVKNDTVNMHLSDLKGKVVLLNFFATWCPPCKKELPKITEEIWNKHKDNEQFELMIVGRGHNQTDLRKFIEKNNYSLPFYADKDKKIFGSFAKDIIPRSYIINKNGLVVYQSLGFNEDEFKKIVHIIDSLLIIK